MDRYVVFTEIHHEDAPTERWYWGIWEDRNKANEVALELGKDYERMIFHCVCNEKDARKFGIQNLPIGVCREG